MAARIAALEVWQCWDASSSFVNVVWSVASVGADMPPTGWDPSVACTLPPSTTTAWLGAPT